jgi:tripartite-type tricarboxylate transporter receptor subunit TctC
MGMRRRELLGVLGGAAVGPLAASAQQTMPVGLSLLSLINSAAAQTWPTRAIKLIVSTGPGLATDIMARLLSDRLSRALGQQIFVENIPVAAGMIGAQAAVRSPPDGYTFYFAPASAISSNMFLYKSVPYDPINDFTPVAMICDSGPFAISVQPTLPINTLPDLIAYAKAHPGAVSYGVDTSSGYAVVLGQVVGKRAMIDWVQVPYKSTPQMLQDATAGVTQATISSSGATLPLARDGKLRIVAISSEKRFPGLDELPTIAETIPGIAIDGWFAVVAPAKTPAPIIERMNKEIDVALKDTEFKSRLRALGLATSGAGTPQSTGDFIRAQIERWRGLVKELDIQPQ